MLWIYRKEIREINEKENKGMNQRRSRNDGDLRWEEGAEWHMEGHTWLYVGYFQSPDFNSELWSHGFLLQNSSKQTNIGPCIYQRWERVMN